MIQNLTIVKCFKAWVWCIRHEVNRTICLEQSFFCLVSFLLGVAGASFYWFGYMTENEGMESAAIMLSGVMILIAILTIGVIKAYEDREK